MDTQTISKPKKSDLIIDTVCEHYKITREQMINIRPRPYISFRQLAIYLLVKHTDLKLREIGEIFHLNHSTVIHSRETVEDQYGMYKDYRAEVDKVNLLLKDIL